MTTSASVAAVLDIGATSAIGYGIRPMQAAMAGGLRNFAEGSVKGADGQPARLSGLPDLDEDASRAKRIAHLSRCAIADLAAQTSHYLSSNIPVFVGVADDAPKSDFEVIGRALAESADGLLRPQASAFFGYRGGRIAFLTAMAHAMGSLAEGGVDVALVMAVDTKCTWQATNALMRERRLLTERDDGTIPGEAAVAALIATPDSALAREHARFVITDPMFGGDDFDTLRQAPQGTSGLARAFRAVREHPIAGAWRATAIVAFESGELFFTRAFATGYLRNADLMPEPLVHEGVASNVGDTGAAAAGMALVRADGLMRQHEAGDHRILIYGHSDDGRCAATMLVKTKGREP